MSVGVFVQLYVYPIRESFTNTLCGNIRLLDLHTHATRYGENLHAMTNNNKVEIDVQHGTNCTFVICKLHIIFQNDIGNDTNSLY